MYQALFITLLFAGRGLSQCFTNTDCTGNVVEAADRRDCCVKTSDGLSFNDGSSCNLCIGKAVYSWSYNDSHCYSSFSSWFSSG